MIDLSGCILSDDPEADLFVIPGGTTIAAGGFVSFDTGVLGFALSSAGETVYLKNPDATRVVDALRFGGQAPGVSLGRQPDGNPHLIGELSTPTRGADNSVALVREVVITEIMYHPLDATASEYVEFFNRGTQAVDISGWTFVEGLDFAIPAGTMLPAGGFVVV
ncbi:MAG: lamin tail domain-containing protein, partial [bacterium]|nr:lamin tail domain-containing protein [bacterium]